MQPNPLLPTTYWSVEKRAQGSTKLMLLCRNYHCLASVSQPFCSTTHFPTQHRGKRSLHTSSRPGISPLHSPRKRALQALTLHNTTQAAFTASSQQRCCGTGRAGTAGNSEVVKRFWFSIVLQKLIEPCLTEGVGAHSDSTSDCPGSKRFLSMPAELDVCAQVKSQHREMWSHELWCTLTSQKETKSLSFWILLLRVLKMTVTKMECTVTFLSTYLKS